MQYRSEIDGLRALAVLPVILFHAGFHSFSGGFVGVDVFFVISGYLITSIILRDLETGTFSLKHFYERRARRILPTLFFVFLTCIPLATLLMSPSELKDFALSLGASLVFISNIFFWGQSGYFDTASELKPLIHTWSLSVEEQFYVLFPLALAGLWRSKKRNMIAALIALAVASLLLSEYASRTFPSFNFFWLATRAWELLAGALCAFLVVNPKRIRDDLLSLIGIILITASIFYFDSSTRSPSAISLMPVMGTCLVILFGTQTTITAQFLSLRPFVAIGLISYSAYIWHQPLFAFSRIGAAREPSTEWMLLLILVVLLFAYLTWKYIEQPFRGTKTIKRVSLGFLVRASGVATFLFVAFIATIQISNGFEAKDRFLSLATNLPPKIASEIIVLGDSHAGHLLPGLTKITSGQIVDLTSPGCIPFRNLDRYDARYEKGTCVNKVNKNLDDIILSDPNAIIIISNMGPVYLLGTSFKGKGRARTIGNKVVLTTEPSITDPWIAYELGLRQTLTELSALQKAKIVVAIDVPELGIDFGCRRATSIAERINARSSDFPNCYVSRDDYDLRMSSYIAFMKEILKDYPKVIVYDPTDDFCDQTKCSGYREEFGFLYSDYDHLSKSGSLFFALNLTRVLAAGDSKK